MLLYYYSLCLSKNSFDFFIKAWWHLSPQKAKQYLPFFYKKVEFTKLKLITT